VQAIDPKGSFAKNLILSLVLIGVTSLLFPLVLKQIDDRKAQDQQRYQDELSRQDTILNAQATLIDTMAADFWEYELYATDLVISRDPLHGDAAWHQRAIETYYGKSGQQMGIMRSEISTLLRLAPRSTYDSFLAFFNEEIQPLDGCLLELINQDRKAAATPVSAPQDKAGGTPTPAACSPATGKFSGATWDTLAESILAEDFTNRLDHEFEALAEVFRLDGSPDSDTAP
jgi:hypothetical protein